MSGVDEPRFLARGGGYTHSTQLAEEFRCKVEHRAMVARDQRRRQLVDLLEPIGLAELADEDEDEYQLKIVRELARRLGAIPEHVLAEFSA